MRSPITGSVKITKEMVFSIACHPSEQALLSLVGDKLGNLALWDISATLERNKELDATVTEVEPVVSSFKPFRKPISKIAFNHGNLNQAYLSSYDGTLRLMDLETRQFTELLIHPEGDMLSHFSLTSQNPHEIWISDGSGLATLLDTRVPYDPASSTSTHFYTLSDKKINTIHANPRDPNYLVTAGLDRTVRIFDVRKLAPAQPLADNHADPAEALAVLPHRLSVNSAYWDPSGRDVISTSFDDTLGLWKEVLREAENGLVSIKHGNNTGRWVQKFKSVWRGQEGFAGAEAFEGEGSVFIIGNMQRSVDVFSGATGKQVATLIDNSLTAIPAVNVFHPTLNMIVSGNASGRMNVWTA
ncbi:WD40-repeat-containing domain protein [Chytriomyces sp. MP71]|nr:WD40-repeat-containing domain protein [Chytriomyces sp. MP71]